jgi:hypothetical protein
LPLSNHCRLMTRRYCKWATKWCAAIDWLRQLNLLIWYGGLFPVNSGNSRTESAWFLYWCAAIEKMGGNSRWPVDVNWSVVGPLKRVLCSLRDGVPLNQKNKNGRPDNFSIPVVWAWSRPPSRLAGHCL